MRLGLIGDDRDNAGWLAGRLEQAGFGVLKFASVNDALRDRPAENLSALMLDLGAASPQATNLVTALRCVRLAQPMMVLSTRSDWREKVDCLDAGADDYVIKPVRSEEIVARLRAIIRRRAGGNTNRLELGDLTLDLKARCAWQGTRCLDLTRSEFRLLQLFLFQPERMLSHRDIREQLYSPGTPVSDNAVEVQVARLRRKLGAARIKTVRGLGYRYIAEPGSVAAPEDLVCGRRATACS